MESIFRNVDEDKTIEKAETVLKDYWKWKLRARRARFNLQSPSMDGMPQSPSFENHVDEKHVNKLNAEFMANLVVNVIKAVGIDEQTDRYSRALYFFYIKRYSKVKCMACMDHISDKTFDKYLHEGQLAFAEVYPDAVENLIVKKPRHYEPEERVDFSFN